MKGFLNEPFVDRIFGFSTNSATKLDLDLKRRLVEIFFESNKSPIKTKKNLKTSKISLVVMETTMVAKDSEKPSDRSQTKFMTLFNRKMFTELKLI